MTGNGVKPEPYTGALAFTGSLTRGFRRCSVEQALSRWPALSGTSATAYSSRSTLYVLKAILAHRRGEVKENLLHFATDPSSIYSLESRFQPDLASESPAEASTPAHANSIQSFPHVPQQPNELGNNSARFRILEPLGLGKSFHFVRSQWLLGPIRLGEVQGPIAKPTAAGSGQSY